MYVTPVLDTPPPFDDDSKEVEVFVPDYVEQRSDTESETKTLLNESKEISHYICVVTGMVREACDVVSAFLNQYRLVCIPQLFSRYTNEKNVVVASRGILFVGDLKVNSPWTVYPRWDIGYSVLDWLGLPRNTLTFLHRATSTRDVLGVWPGPVHIGTDTTVAPLLYGPALVPFSGVFSTNSVLEVIHTGDSSRLYHERRRITHPDEYIVGYPKDQLPDGFLRWLAGWSSDPSRKPPLAWGVRALHEKTLVLTEIAALYPKDLERATSMVDGYLCVRCWIRFVDKLKPRDPYDQCAACRRDPRPGIRAVEWDDF